MKSILFKSFLVIAGIVLFIVIKTFLDDRNSPSVPPAPNPHDWIDIKYIVHQNLIKNDVVTINFVNTNKSSAFKIESYVVNYFDELNNQIGTTNRPSVILYKDRVNSDTYEIKLPKNYHRLTISMNNVVNYAPLPSTNK